MRKKINFHLKPFFVHCLTLLIMLASSFVNADKEVSFTSELAADKTYALIDTSMGRIEFELYAKRTPKTVENFIEYAESGFYADTLFHRVIPNFMVQGGGFNKSFIQKASRKPVRNEANAFIPNLRGTISMARTSDPDSATSQFFIFGKVIKGLDVADKISKVKTKREGHMADVPVEPVILNKVIIKRPEKTKPEAVSP